MEDITHIEIRMYGTGTGDCFILKYFNKQKNIFSMMIDGGTWKGKKPHLNKYVNHLKKYIDNKIDLLIISHEHKDHLYLFNACEQLFTNNFTVGEIWMAWSEDDDDELAKEWKDLFGQTLERAYLRRCYLEENWNQLNRVIRRCWVAFKSYYAEAI